MPGRWPDRAAALASAVVAFGLWLPAASALADAAAPDSVRQRQLLHLLKQDCGSCHGLTRKGGLGPPLTPQALVERDDDALVETILNGRPGTAMPPWGVEISRPEAEWLVGRLRKEDLGG